ncbi:hypothetical protein C0J52_24647 [Blattella germanica]|nr:hypothetical protein C0J52_24647 [Blattella germanica]
MATLLVVRANSIMEELTQNSKTIEDLPDEILSLIFTYIPGFTLVHEVANVCRKWKSFATKDKCLWRNKWGFFVPDDVEDFDFVHMTAIRFMCHSYEQCLTFIAKLNASNCKIKKFEIYVQFADKIDDVLEQISHSSSFKDLEHLCFNGYLRNSRNISELPKLKVLKISDNVLGLCENFQRFINGCSALSMLHLVGLENMNYVVLKFMTAKFRNTLVDLRLGIYKMNSYDWLSDLVNLKWLRIDLPHGWHMNIFFYLANLKKLKYVSLYVCGCQRNRFTNIRKMLPFPYSRTTIIVEDIVFLEHDAEIKEENHLTICINCRKPFGTAATPSSLWDRFVDGDPSFFDTFEQFSQLQSENSTMEGLTQNSTTIEDLPDEILSHIFTYIHGYTLVHKVANVCEKWRSIVKEDKCLWRNKWGVFAAEDVDKFDFVHMTAIRILSSSPGQTLTFIAKLDSNNCKIKKFHVGLISPGEIDDVLDQLSRSSSFEDLEHLSFCGILWKNQNLMKCFPKLKALFISNLYLHDDGFLLFIDCCAALSTLHLVRCTNVTYRCAKYMSTKLRDTLVNLRIDGLYMYSYDWLSDLVNLEYLTVDDARYWNMDSFRSLADLRKLKCVTLEDCVFHNDFREMHPFPYTGTTIILNDIVFSEHGAQIREENHLTIYIKNIKPLSKLAGLPSHWKKYT